MKKGSFKSYAIDDNQYLMAFESFSRAKEMGYNKFTEMFLHSYDLINFVITQLPNDVIVYFLNHTETTDSGKIKAKTQGKMMDNQGSYEGFFTIVLLCKTDGKEHFFETQSDGFTTCKSPIRNV